MSFGILFSYWISGEVLTNGELYFIFSMVIKAAECCASGLDLAAQVCEGRFFVQVLPRGEGPLTLRSLGQDS